jgi:hypothetical protein
MEAYNTAIEAYRAAWQDVVEARADKQFFSAQSPTALGWKVEDADELYRRFDEIRDLCDQIHFGWVNERWLITLHLKDQTFAWGMQIIKLMQRRPGSKDAIGLDHIDFYSSANNILSEKLAQEVDIKWNVETNGEYCKWVSVWFVGGEAKLRTDTALSPCIAEMREIEEHILKMHAAE